MYSEETKLDYYKLEKIATYLEKDVDDLLDYADMGWLKIHILVSTSRPFPLSSYAARQAVEFPVRFHLSNENLSLLNGQIILVITHKEKEKFEKKLGRHTSHAHVDPPRPLAKVIRKNPLLDIIINTYDHLASSQNKNPTWKECYEYLMNKDSRKLVDKENYIKTISDGGVFTIAPEENKQFISKESFKKRFQRLVNNK